MIGCGHMAGVESPSVRGLGEDNRPKREGGWESEDTSEGIIIRM